MKRLRVALPRPIPALFDYLCALPGVAPGSRVRVPFGRGELWGVAWAWTDRADVDAARLKPVLASDPSQLPQPAQWRELVEFVADYYQQPIGEVACMALPPRMQGAGRVMRRRLFALTDAGRAALAALPARDVGRKLLAQLAECPDTDEAALCACSRSAPAALERLLAQGCLALRAPTPAAGEAALALTTDQQAALDVLVTDRGFQVSLLHGVTGSGKTEIYLRLIEQDLAAGRQVLLLVPEIALTPQLEARVAARFPQATLAVMHSDMADGARARAWRQAQQGEADILLGTRLAVFVPLPRAGRIIVDEEHDSSFRQHEGVRYSARDVAVWRARQLDVPILLGSATPSLESLQHTRAGRWRRLVLAGRARAASLPSVRCIDTRLEKREDGLTPALVGAIEARLARGEQSLVFLNRRGFSPVLACPSCGWSAGCGQCSANLVFHAVDRRLRCHHCGAEAGVPLACPSCGNQDLRGFGRGTQKLEAWLAQRFPAARVLRLDRDNLGGREHWQAQLDAIRDGAADIVVGTQLLAKGHDFPRLTLVGVVGADASLHAADFRAAERLFAQLMQVGGRAGRAELPGEVLIQTDYPTHPLFHALARHDYDGYMEVLLREREQMCLPPFGHQLLLSADAPELATALEFLGAARRAAEALDCPDVMIYDVVPMRMVRRAGRERAQLLLESPSRPALRALLKPWIAGLYRLRLARGLRWHVDVDPLDI